jgi:hypothetical protein
MKTCLILAFVAMAGIGAAAADSEPPPVVVAPTPVAPQPATTLPPAPVANPSPPPSAPAQLGAAELERLAAPIALYPDPLLPVLLPASV